MKVVVRFSAAEELEALPILLRHSLGEALPGRTNVISVEAAEALRRAGVAFAEVEGESCYDENAS